MPQRKNVCQACNFILSGVKTRKAIPHSCGKSNEQLIELHKQAKEHQKSISDKRN